MNINDSSMSYEGLECLASTLVTDVLMSGAPRSCVEFTWVPCHNV